MDELTSLRNTRDDSRIPSPEAMTAGRTALLDRIDGVASTTRTRPTTKRRWVPQLTWAAAATAAAITGVLVAGNITSTAEPTYASEFLRSAAVQTVQYADIVPGSGQYLRSRTHARWGICNSTGCTPNDQILDVYMPADPDTPWVLYRDWGTEEGVYTDESIETIRADDGRFYGPDSSWVNVDYTDIPLDGDAAYQWIDDAYLGGSASRDEDNYVRISDILRSGLVPAPQRAALLDALSRIPGVTATNDVENLDGITGVAIGRNEPLREGERQEIIIDPQTGLIIGERTVTGAGSSETTSGPTSLTAIETTVVDTAP